MRISLTIVAVLLGFGVAPDAAARWTVFENYTPDVVVSDPYIEIRTGPGRGYPIFSVAGQGEIVTLLKRKTNWIKVRSGPSRGGSRDRLEHRVQEGWVHINDMNHTLDLDGAEIEFDSLEMSDFSNRRWEVGFNGGDFGGANSLTGYVGYAFTPNITVQIEATQILGEFSDGVISSANILMYPFPQWRISPYFTIGTGIIQTKPHTTVVLAEDRQDEIVHAGAGANIYLSDRFMLRMEYKRHTVLTSRDDNEEIDQWKAGFSVFF